MIGKDTRVLIVEDDPDSQDVVATIVSHLNIPLDIASTFEEAEQYLFQSKTHYSAAIMDLALPDRNGWELLSKIQSDPETAELPCIAVTAHHSSKLREDTIKAGFAAYFSKPINLASLTTYLENLL
jgi:CheY-like chemotaxis protein